jgi:hypothetical protein
MNQPQLLDVVALLLPVPSEALQMTDEQYDLSPGLEAGSVGTVVEVVTQEPEPSMFLVEFSDSDGRGYAFATVPAEALLVLHYEPSESLTAHPS